MGGHHVDGSAGERGAATITSCMAARTVAKVNQRVEVRLRPQAWEQPVTEALELPQLFHQLNLP